jgi:hypothetical protein
MFEFRIMKNYKCYFYNGDQALGEPRGAYSAESPKAACAAFIAEHGPIGPNVSVSWGLLGSLSFTCEEYKSKKDELALEKAEAERREWESSLSAGLSIMTSKSYLESEPRDREGLSGLVLSIATEFEKRPLDDLEISFVKEWANFKDRGLGESLLTSLGASKPKEERGKSPGINAALLMSAMQYQKLDSMSRNLDEMSDDVDTVSDLVEED